tara:strand:+ start:1353 stop:1595 length:243 start_codon:yes stop_codon:yes gene_type:complete
MDENKYKHININVGDIVIDHINDEIGIIIKTDFLFNRLKIWEVHWTRSNNIQFDDNIHHYTEEGLQILIGTGALVHHPGI